MGEPSLIFVPVVAMQIFGDEDAVFPKQREIVAECGDDIFRLVRTVIDCYTETIRDRLDAVGRVGAGRIADRRRNSRIGKDERSSSMSHPTTLTASGNSRQEP